MAITWIKVTTNIFDDPKVKIIETLPEGKTLVLLWMKLLVEAGKANAGGYIQMNDDNAYTKEDLAVIFREPLEVVERALQLFSSKRYGLIEIEEDGSIYVSNWEKHQNIEGMERVRELTRKRVAKHRKKQAVTPVTLQVALRNAIDIDIDKELDLDIDKDRYIYSVNPAIDKTFVVEMMKKYSVSYKGVYELELIESYVGVIDHELISEAIKRSEKMNAKYAHAILKRWTEAGYKALSDLPEHKPRGGKLNELDKPWSRNRRTEKETRNAHVASPPGRAPFKPRD